jgi:hypothetical protein
MRRSKPSGKAEKSPPISPAASPRWGIETTKRFDKKVAAYGLGERQLIDAALTRFPEAFGHEHIHAGLGIRRLAKKPPLFECRAGLGIRLVFEVFPRRLTFDFAGNHDEVEAYLKNRT